MITQEELEKLENCNSVLEWNTVENEIRAARDNEYPPDWVSKVILANIWAHVAAKQKVIFKFMPT